MDYGIDLYDHNVKVMGTIDDATNIGCNVSGISAKNVNSALGEITDSLNNTNTKLNNYILYRTETFTGHNETVTGNGYLANQSVNLSIPSGYKLLCLIEVACSNHGNLIIANPQVTNTGTVSYVVDNLRSYDNNVGGNITVKYLCVKN